MNKALLLTVFCVASGVLDAQDLRIVNAASLTQVKVPPGSIITIFGTRLTTGVAAAEDAKLPPTTLNGVTVSIGGTPASLFYVSPTQINALVGAATPLGTDEVVVTSASGAQKGSLTVAADAPPGLFSLHGSGTRDGAILNAITMLLGDFSPQTASLPTYLALFATGLTSTTPTVTIGGVPVEVVYAGPTACCAGLQQINVKLPESLAGAGRVPVTASVNGQVSNTVQIVLLPPATAKQFPGDQDNQKRSRELAALAYVPGTSLVVSTDQNDDVVRTIDVSTKAVVRLIALPKGANPTGVAVNAAGTIAAVAESGRGKVAILDLVKNSVAGEVATGAGASSVAISGSLAIVVNADEDSATIVDLVKGAALKTLSVGRGPASVAADSVAQRAYVTNENDGTISVVDLAAMAVTKTISLGASIRPEAIALVGATGMAFVTAPGNGPEGNVLLVNLGSGATTALEANPDRTGGSTDAAYWNGKIYFANQTGGSVAVLAVNAATGAAAGPITQVKAGLGPRALAIDTNDNLLVASNEGTGTLALIDLQTNTVVARIDAVRSAAGDDTDDDSDRDRASNRPTVESLSPASGKAGATLTVTLAGANLTGATEITFGGSQGNGNGNGNGRAADISAKNIVVSADGKQLTAAITIDASAKPGARPVQVETANGESRGGSVTFTVLP